MLTAFHESRKIRSTCVTTRNEYARKSYDYSTKVANFQGECILTGHAKSGKSAGYACSMCRSRDSCAAVPAAGSSPACRSRGGSASSGWQRGSPRAERWWISFIVLRPSNQPWKAAMSRSGVGVVSGAAPPRPPGNPTKCQVLRRVCGRHRLCRQDSSSGVRPGPRCRQVQPLAEKPEKHSGR